MGMMGDVKQIKDSIGQINQRLDKMKNKTESMEEEIDGMNEDIEHLKNDIWIEEQARTTFQVNMEKAWDGQIKKIGQND